MPSRDIAGRPALDRDGIAERYDRSSNLIDWLVAGRDANGFPSPIEVEQGGRGVRLRNGQLHGREWYAVEDTDAFFTAYATAGQARVAGTPLAGDPEELLDARKIAVELDISYDTWRGWVKDSIPDWEAGRPGYVPWPDLVEQADGPHGYVHRYWKRGTIQTAFVDARPGKGRGAKRGRPPGGGATLNDYHAAVDRLPAGATVNDIAREMNVSAQVVKRLRRKLRDEQSSQAPPAALIEHNTLDRDTDR